jgi:hypothetical protein
MSVKARRQHQQAEFDTIQKIVNSLGVKLVAEPIRKIGAIGNLINQYTIRANFRNSSGVAVSKPKNSR